LGSRLGQEVAAAIANANCDDVTVVVAMRSVRFHAGKSIETK
jgi:hypothetical protein